MNINRYKRNLKVDGDKVYSYDTHVATIDQEINTLWVHGSWSATTSRHVNFVAKVGGLKKRESSEDSYKDRFGDRKFAT